MKPAIAFSLALAAAAPVLAPAMAQETSAKLPAPSLNLKSEVAQSWSAPEATQGVAVDARHFYAVANSRIAKYDRATGKKVAEWKGDPARYPHLNSCSVIGKELVCAGSSFPTVPMWSAVEIFDPERMTHLRTVSLGHQIGSLTWIDRKDGAWWATFANYDEKGGEPGHGHAYTQFVKFDDQWRRQESWLFPASVLDRVAPMSSSGGAWGEDGYLYVSGHDRPEVYVMRLPDGGGVLDHVATVEVAVEGQAVAFDRSSKRLLFGIRRPTREVVAMRLPTVSVSSAK